MSHPISSVPALDPAALLCFKQALGRSRCYLEYGCGGSTVYAVSTAKVPVIVSVESDPAWSGNVKASLEAVGAAGASRLYLEHCDVGEVGDWGTPKSRERIDGFWRYMALPWQIARQHNLHPDTVMVDGRFRVASFLYSLMSARVGTLILFDDYMERPHYHVVEEFCDLVESHGRMATFVTGRNYSVPALCERIAQYSINWA